MTKLDSIIFSDIDNYKDGYDIRDILNYVREYTINSIKDKKIYDKKSSMIILEFINYLVQESYNPITNLFNNHMKVLRSLIIKFKDNRLYISDEKIDFDNDCYTFVREIINSNDID